MDADNWNFDRGIRYCRYQNSCENWKNSHLYNRSYVAGTYFTVFIQFTPILQNSDKYPNSPGRRFWWNIWSVDFNNCQIFRALLGK